MKKIVIMVFITVSLIATQTIAGDFKGSIKIDKDTAIEQVKINIVEAIEIAKKKIDGRVIEAELEKEDGYLVWEIEILDKNKQEHEIIVDPVTGDVLYQERED